VIDHLIQKSLVSAVALNAYIVVCRLMTSMNLHHLTRVVAECEQ